MIDLSEGQRQSVIQAARQEAMRRSAKDGWFWATTFVWTRDEADQDSVKRFPNKLYLGELWRIIHENQRVVVAKSRQVMVSWILCAYCVWVARFTDHKLILWQTQKEDDGHAMVALAGVGELGGYAGRMQFILRNLPTWMRGRWVEKEGELISLDTQSSILALPGGAHQVRSKTASLIVEDEFAFQSEQGGVYQAVAPLIQKQTKFIAVSTPNGRNNTFADLFFGVQQVAR